MPSAGTVERLSRSYREQGGTERWRLQAAADLLQGRDQDAQQRTLDRWRADPEAFEKESGGAMADWVAEQERREEAGEMPLESGSP